MARRRIKVTFQKVKGWLKKARFYLFLVVSILVCIGMAKQESEWNHHFNLMFEEGLSDSLFQQELHLFYTKLNHALDKKNIKSRRKIYNKETVRFKDNLKVITSLYHYSSAMSPKFNYVLAYEDKILFSESFGGEYTRDFFKPSDSLRKSKRDMLAVKRYLHDETYYNVKKRMKLVIEFEIQPQDTLQLFKGIGFQFPNESFIKNRTVLSRTYFDIDDETMRFLELN